MHFIICDRLERFKGIKELLLAQEMFAQVSFVREMVGQQLQIIMLDDTGSPEGHNLRPISTHQMWNFVKQNTGIDFPIDDNFDLNVPRLDIDYHKDKFIIGDRWSPKDAPDVDDRRYSNLIQSADIIPEDKAFYLDYTQDLLYNCALVKYNPKPFISTFTGIGILADLMHKDSFILWDEDMRTWQGKPVEHDWDLHYYKNRKTKLMYVRDFKA